MRGLALATLFLGLCLLKEGDADVTPMRVLIFLIAMGAISVGL
jgi:hypothetical protein